MSQAPEKKLWFICTGNTCRSPMAEGLMRHLCRSVEGWTFASAGVYAIDGAPASPEAVRVMQEKDLDITGHQSRMLRPGDIKQADWLIAMTDSHRQMIIEADSTAENKTRTLHSFGTGNADRDVMDPVGGSLDTYRITRDEIESALTDLILGVIQPTSNDNPHAGHS